MNPLMEDRVKVALQRALAEWEDISRISREWRSRSLEELLPDLSRDEQLRLQNRIRERDRVLRRRNKEFSPSSASSSSSNSNSSSTYEIRRDSAMTRCVLVALHHYNARHPFSCLAIFTSNSYNNVASMHAEEPLCQYKSSCGFCPADFEILHPKGCRKFVCGNDKDRIGQRLEKCWSQGYQHPFGLFGPSRKGRRS
ncbi:hypothetical protein EJB05_46566 [Eragrostis curvula]|uniref:Uncharacterized protein n=1 Tax=Eragrostis curvula TaxID=38414 RepID=A0A5J9TNN0_9POAL|nr:hypothetical protein EJB05_46566 [Eragrostis curvula]